MWRTGSAWTDRDALARQWRGAQPFPHLVFDDVLTEPALAELFAILDEESVDPYEGDILSFEASPPEPRTAELRAVREAFAAAYAAPLAAITHKVLARADMRAFAYRIGHYLLPHTDHRDGLHRALAYAYYLPSPEPPTGGELELFRCSIADGELTETTSALLIEPRGNRLVVFEVNDVSLHQVREVTAGLRMSLAGWFYP